MLKKTIIETQKNVTGQRTALVPRASVTPSVEEQAQYAELLAAATSENTRRAYRSGVRHFLAWGGVLPADESLIIRYLLAHATVLNSRTLTLRLTALSQWHRQQGFVDPVAKSTVRKTLTGIARVHGTPKKKAKALSVEALEEIVRVLQSQDSLKAKRDNALLQLAFFGGFRRSEVANLRVEYLRWENEGLVIQLPRSKTDQSGEGITKAIPFGEGVCCPATALKIWLSSAGITSGAIFRRITQWGAIGSEALNASSINIILTESAKQAGLTYVAELSSHSLRRGMASSAYRAGADFREIKKQGGWRHDGTVQGYIEEAKQFESNAVSGLLKARRV